MIKLSNPALLNKDEVPSALMLSKGKNVFKKLFKKKTKKSRTKHTPQLCERCLRNPQRENKDRKLKFLF